MRKTIDRALEISPSEFKSILDDELNRFAGLKHDSSEGGGQVEGKGFLVRYEMCPSETGTTLQINVQKKPVWVPWGLLKNRIDSILSDIQ